MCDKCIEDYEEQLMTEAIDAVIGDAIKGFIFIAKNVMGGETASTTVGKLECLEAIDDGKPALDMLYGIFSAAGMKQLADKLHDIILIGYECTEIYSSPVLTGNLMDYTAYKITDLGAQTMAFFAVNKADTASFKVAALLHLYNNVYFKFFSFFHNKILSAIVGLNRKTALLIECGMYQQNLLSVHKLYEDFINCICISVFCNKSISKFIQCVYQNSDFIICQLKLHCISHYHILLVFFSIVKRNLILCNYAII